MNSPLLSLYNRRHDPFPCPGLRRPALRRSAESIDAAVPMAAVSAEATFAEELRKDGRLIELDDCAGCRFDHRAEPAFSG